MGTSTPRFAFAITVTLLLLGTATASAAAQAVKGVKTFQENGVETKKELCQGEYAGKKVTPAQLKMVLDKHEVWSREYDTEEKRTADVAKQDPRRANLCGADLQKADLRGAFLWYVDLSGASLQNANLSGVLLSGTNLSGANLWFADLSKARLWDSNLSGASLQNSNLRKASLWHTNLTGANLGLADLSGARFEPKELPFIDTVAYAKNLHQMYHDGNPQALIKLRKAFSEAGYKEQGRAITCAINRSEEWHGDSAWDRIVGGAFKIAFFNLPTQWGMFPGRALKILVVLLGVFSFPYIYVLRYPGRGRIYRKWGAHNAPVVAARAARSKRRPTAAPAETIESLQYQWKHAVLTGLQFSLLSAFHIGFREFNVGNWISRLQTRDYTLYATGWVRSVAGTQALISVYLLAMWALTYFGRPFE